MNPTARITALLSPSGTARNESGRAVTPSVSRDSNGTGARKRRLPLAILTALALLTSLAFASSASAASATCCTITDVSYTSAHLEAKVTADNPFRTAQFEYSTSEAGPWSNGPSEFLGADPVTDKAVQGTLTVPKGATQYFVRVSVTSAFFGTETVSSPPYSDFTTLAADPPTIPGTVEASPVFSTSAKATAKVIRPTKSDDVKCHFEYISDDQFKANELASAPLFEGATPADCAQNPIGEADADTEKDVTAALTGLQPETAYHLRLIAENAATSSPVVKDGSNFTTLPPVTKPSVIKVNDATDLGYRSAKLSGEIERPAGADPALDIVSCRFEYVTDEQFTNSEFAEATPIGCDQTAGGPIGSEGPTPVTASLTGLKSGVTYHYRLAAENSSGTDTQDAASTFTTTPGGEPTATLDPTPIAGPTKVRLTGTATRGLGFGDSELYVILQYAEAGTENFCCGNGAFQRLPSGSGPHPFIYDFNDLSQDTAYEFRMYVEERNGSESSGELSVPGNPTATTGHLESPTASCDPVTDPTATTAHFSCTVDTHAPPGPLNDLVKAAYKTEWRIECVPECKDVNGNTIAGTVEAEEGSKAISVDAKRLEPDTHYDEVKLVAHNELYSVETPPQEFDTLKSPPSVNQTPGAPDGTGGYNLQGVVNPRNETVTSCKFHWGPESAAKPEDYAFSEDCSPLPDGVDERQRVNVLGAGGGQFRLSFAGQTTGDIAFGAPASVVQSELESLSSIGPSAISQVTFTVFNGDNEITTDYPAVRYDITFSGSLANKNLPPLQAESGTEPTPGGSFQISTLTDGGTNIPITVEAHLTGLNPEVDYHALLVVTYGAGSEGKGVDQTFKATVDAKQPCPANEQQRTESNSLALPECRAYELVTPSGKEGFGAILLGYDGGARVLYGSRATNIAKSGQGRGSLSEGPNWYVTARTDTGWETIPDLNGSSGSLRDAPSYVDSGYASTAPFVYSSDLLSSAWGLHRQGDPANLNLHLRGHDGSFTPIGSFGGTFGDAGWITASADLSHLVNLTVTPWGPGVYEYVGTDMDQPRRVDVDNSGAPVSTCPTVVYGSAQSRSLSSDGNTIVFRAFGGCGPANPPADEIWARVNGTTSFDVSASHCNRAAADPGGLCNGPVATGDCALNQFGEEAGSGCRGATFAAATSDGSRVFFTTTQQLVDEDIDQTNDLYACDLPAGNPAPSADKANHCAAFRQISGAETGAAVETVNATSASGATVLFTAKGVLADNEDALKGKAVPGDHNLYLWRVTETNPDGQTTFVGRLELPDLFDSAQNRNPAQATPDGRYVVFTTANQLLDTDTDTARDVYRYDIEAKELTRVSTNLFGVAGNGNGFDARIPGEHQPTPAAPERLVHPAISDDGTKIVFTTTEALSPADGNAEPDVYLWTPARVSLISTGSAGYTGEPKAAIDPSGEDIYFDSLQPLTPADGDSSKDVYDARIGGGFSFAPPPVCTGEGCQPPPIPQSPNPPSPANTPNGDGNVKPPKPCPKGKVRKKNGKCVKRNKHKKHSGKKHHSKNNKRAGSNGGGNK